MKTLIIMLLLGISAQAGVVRHVSRDAFHVTKHVGHDALAILKALF